MAKGDPYTAEYLKECLSYDPNTGDLRWLRRPSSHFRSRRWELAWNNRFSGKIAGTKRVVQPSGRRHQVGLILNMKQISAHRVIAIMMGWDIRGKEIDHINRNPWDNRLSNLRVATQAQNLANSKKKRSFTGGAVVGARRDRGRWRSVIGVNGNDLYLGMFATKAEAALAYAKASLRYHGKFSVYYKTA